MSSRLLGVDVGTTNAKAALIDESGRLLGLATQAHPTFSPAPGCQEQDPEDWWRGACAAIRRVLASSRTDPAEVAAVSFSGQGCSCLPIAEDGRPLGRALIWTDARATVEKARIRQIFGDALGEQAGNDIYDQPEPRMLWLRDHEPERYERTSRFLTTVSYLAFRCSGAMVASTADWSFHLAFDRRTRGWNQELVAGLGLNHECFPALVAPYDVIGAVSEAAAAATGLRAGTPAIAGAQDSIVLGLAAGVLGAGQSYYARGSTDLLCFCTSDGDYHPDRYTACSILPGLYMSYDMREVVAAGGSYRWLASILFDEEDPAHFEVMNRLAAGAPPGATGVTFLPHLYMSTRPDPADRRSGLFFGLTTATSRGALCRAVMEGTAYALRESIDRMRASGAPIHELRTTGGPANSALWNQITADVTGLPLRLPVVSEGAAAYGAALLAGLGVGAIPRDDGFAALGRLIRIGRSFEPQGTPDEQPRVTYEAAYRTYCGLAAATSGWQREQ